VLFSLVYFAVVASVAYFFSVKYGIFDQILGAVVEYNKSGQNYAEYQQNVAKIVATEEFSTFYFAVMAAVCFLFPLNMGFYEIYRKLDSKETIMVGDLFAGYRGINFFRFISYFVFWLFLYLLTARTLIIPIFWVFTTILVAPILYFSKFTFLNAVILNFKLLKVYFLEIFVCVIVAFVFKFAGLMLFLVGGLLTFPFWNAMIYSLFKEIFKTPEMQSLLAEDFLDSEKS
jgi:hypothetical protein